jgi:hypothetical protein
VRQLGEQRSEAGDERPVHVVGQQHQVGTLRLHQAGELADRLLAQGDARGVAGIDEEKRLDPGILELRELGVSELVVVLLQRLDGDHVQGVVLELRHLDVRREGGRPQRDGVAGAQQPVRLQGLEDVAHGGRSTLDREEVELAGRPGGGAQRPHQVLVGDALGVDQHPVGHRVVVADDGVHQLVDEGVRLEPEGLHGERHQRREEGRARHVGMRGQPRLQPGRDPLGLRHAAQPGRMLHHPLALGDGELPEQEEAVARRRGDPVGIPPAGVEERRLRDPRGLLGQLDQLVLDLERAERLVLFELHVVH